MIEKAIKLGNLAVARYMATRSETIDLISSVPVAYLSYFAGKPSHDLASKANVASSLVTKYVDAVQKKDNDLQICNIVAKMHDAVNEHHETLENIRKSGLRQWAEDARVDKRGRL